MTMRLQCRRFTRTLSDRASQTLFLHFQTLEPIISLSLLVCSGHWKQSRYIFSVENCGRLLREKKHTQEDTRGREMGSICKGGRRRHFLEGAARRESEKRMFFFSFERFGV